MRLFLIELYSGTASKYEVKGIFSEYIKVHVHTNYFILWTISKKIMNVVDPIIYAIPSLDVNFHFLKIIECRKAN